MKAILFTSFIFLTTLLVAQKPKIDVKKDVVSIDGVPSFKLVNTPDLNGFILKDMNDTKLAFFNMESYYDRSHINDANPQGKITYFDITFMNESMDKCEMSVIGLRKMLANYLLEYDVIKDGKLNAVGVQQFVRIHGTKYSEQRRNSTTIIINNK